jgi:phasin family protein
MFQAAEQFAALNKSTLNAAALYAGIALVGAERMFKLQFKAAKSALASGAQQFTALAEIKDAEGLALWKSASAQPMMESATSYFKSVYDVATATQSEINKLVEKQVAGFNKQIVTSLDKVMESAPPGSEAAVAAIKSSITAVNSAYDNLSKSAKQIADMTQANVDAAATQAAQATRKIAA